MKRVTRSRESRLTPVITVVVMMVMVVIVSVLNPFRTTVSPVIRRQHSAAVPLA